MGWAHPQQERKPCVLECSNTVQDASSIMMEAVPHK